VTRSSRQVLSAKYLSKHTIISYYSYMVGSKGVCLVITSLLYKFQVPVIHSKVQHCVPKLKNFVTTSSIPGWFLSWQYQLLTPLQLL
jgi:hypothetical protein